jgi:integrase
VLAEPLHPLESEPQQVPTRAQLAVGAAHLKTRRGYRDFRVECDLYLGAGPRSERPFHDLRHTALTHEAAAGNPQAYIQLKAGHSQGTITER